MDPILNIMLALKNKWSLTEANATASDITFTTGWYDESIAFPQISVTPARSNKSLMECGDKPLYLHLDTVFVNIWVRPLSDSVKSLGQAKHIDYVLRTEVDRIVRSGSHLASGSGMEQFMHLGRWQKHDETNLRPVILRSMKEIKVYYYRNYDEDE